MQIKNSVALVTGANRGLGLVLARQLVARGARTVYAAARDPQAVSAGPLGALPAIVPVRLDVTDPVQVAAAASACGDVSLLVNNAGISRHTGLLADDAIAAARAELETNVIGPLATGRAFAPVLARNGGGAIINVLSVLSWVTLPSLATYSASKAAAWSLTNGLRNELRGQGTQVLAVHVGYMDTDMAAHVPGAKTSPDDVARQILDALEAGQDEILADALSRQVKQGLSAPRGVYLSDPA
jgi:NAD(P)-dependent dehydrogenase (short-subunit alcohol dehydrogenase family)